MMGCESFLKFFRLKWAEPNEALGNSLLPLPPVFDMDSYDLHTQYLGCILLRRKENEGGGPDFRRWIFDSYEEFLDHIVAVEQQVVEMRQAQAPDNDVRFKQRLDHCAPAMAELGLEDRFGFQEQSKIAACDLARIQARRVRRQKLSGAVPLPGFSQQGADTLGLAPQSDGSTRERKHNGGGPEIDAIAIPSIVDAQDVGWVGGGGASASKKTKRGRSKIEQHCD